jgi:hypothetical protein
MNPVSSSASLPFTSDNKNLLNNMPKIAVDVPAPDFSLMDYTGRSIRLFDFRGKNVILIFNRTFM